MNSIFKTLRFLWLALAFVLILGGASYLHFLVTGSYEVLVAFFSTAGAAFFVVMAGIEVFFAHLARRQFDVSEPMHTAWTLFFLSSSCRFTGVFSAQILVTHSAAMRDVGLVLSGPVAMALTAAGLACVIRLARRFHLLRSISTLEKAAICAILLFTVRQLLDVAVILGVKRVWPGTVQALLWFSDPLLTMLLIQAVLVRRTVRNVGYGLITACWGMMALGAVFTSLGDIFLFATSYGYLPEALVPIGWFAWFFPAVAYAGAPCFQVEADRRAHQQLDLLVEPRA